MIQTRHSTEGAASRVPPEIIRLLAAAVINPRFCKLLLSNPVQAIENGYGGERFHLAREEKRRVAAIRAATLADFATQLNQAMEPGAAASYSIGD